MQARLSRPGAATSPLAAIEDDLESILPGVVKVFCDAAAPDVYYPWSLSRPQSSTGSGFIVDSRYRLIVTNAHCVDFARTIQLRREGQNDKFEARILSILHQVDLAVLTVRSR